MQRKLVCSAMEDLKAGSRLLVTGVVVGAVGLGFYRVLQNYCGDNDEDLEEELKVDLQSLMSNCGSQPSLNSNSKAEVADNTNVIEIPVDIRALGVANQNVVVQIKAINNPYQNATTQCCVRGEETGRIRRKSPEDESANIQGQIVIENRNYSYGQNPRYDNDTSVDETELFDSESIRRLDGAINEVNYMLQRLGSVLEKTRVDFASRRASVLSRDYRGSDRYMNM